MPEAGISADDRARRPPCPIPHDNPRGSRSCSSRPARACNGRTPFRAIAGAVPTLPREGRTQMSPTLSIVGFVGGSRSSAAHAGLGARRQMRRHARQLASRSRGRGEGYFFLRVVLRLVFFAVFFAADFVFDLALFAITALLAIRDGDFGTVQVANRHALHSDYYSTMRKTATPLNESWTARALARPALRNLACAPPATMFPAGSHAMCARKFRRRTKNLAAQRFPRCEPVRVSCARTAARRSARTSR